MGLSSAVPFGTYPATTKYPALKRRAIYQAVPPGRTSSANSAINHPLFATTKDTEFTKKERTRPENLIALSSFFRAAPFLSVPFVLSVVTNRLSPGRSRRKRNKPDFHRGAHGVHGEKKPNPSHTASRLSSPSCTSCSSWWPTDCLRLLRSILTVGLQLLVVIHRDQPLRKKLSE